MTDYEKDILAKLEKMIVEKGVSNEFLVQLIELAGGYLNLMTIADYAKGKSMSYNGVKKCRNVVKIFKTKYVIDNE